jgi:hypothetical protein
VLEMNAENDPELFSMAKVGLGCLGVVTELTLKVSASKQLLLAGTVHPVKAYNPQVAESAA